jgi:Mandelate racemase / muconate lactonizing enzyme, N-terminal domain
MMEVQKKLHIFGRSGPLFYGISAIDIALWDIAGKAANAPLCRILKLHEIELPAIRAAREEAGPHVGLTRRKLRLDSERSANERR